MRDETIRSNGKAGITRAEWDAIKWGSQPIKQCGGDCWNIATRIQGAFDHPEVAEVVSAPMNSGTGLYTDVLVRLGSGELAERRVYA